MTTCSRPRLWLSVVRGRTIGPNPDCCRSNQCNRITPNGAKIMQRDYRLAMYALAISTVLVVASGATVIAGANQSGGPGDGPINETTEARLDANQQQFNVTVTGTDNGEYTFQQAQRTCSGALRLDSPERNSTRHQVGNVTVTLLTHHDGATVDTIGRQRLAELVIDETSGRAGLGEYSQTEVQVNQYYESTERDEPLDVAGIHVRPVDDCLPSVRGTVNRINETVDVRTVRSDVDEVNLNFTDDTGALKQDDRQLIERLVVTDAQTSYNIRAHLDATTLEATVTEATADGTIDIELQRPGRNGTSVMLTVNLDAETIAHSWVERKIDTSNIEMHDGDDSVEVYNVSNQTDSVAIDFDESNVTVVNETTG